jgi:hypothetical protein
MNYTLVCSQVFVAGSLCANNLFGQLACIGLAIAWYIVYVMAERLKRS